MLNWSNDLNDLVCQVLGHQLITEGICDILVSWTYPNSDLDALDALVFQLPRDPGWIAGQGVLFHGPDALGMKVVEYHDGRAWVA